MGWQKIPYRVAKNGRFYFQPTAELRRLGFAPMAFGTDEEEANRWCRARHAEILQARKAPAAPPAPAGKGKGARSAAPPRAGTVSAWLAEYRASAKFAKLKPKTREFYRPYLDRIERLWGAAPVVAVGPDALAKAYDRLYATSPSSAFAFGSVMRLFFNFVAKRRRTPSPTSALELVKPARANRVWTATEVLHLTAVAGRLDPIVADGILMLLFLPHNPQDVVGITAGQIAADTFVVARGKTSRRSILAVPPFLAQRMLARVAAADGTWKPDARLLPVTKVELARRFAAIRLEAAKTMPAVADLELRQLRRTARSWAEAGSATGAMTANLLGHSQAQAAKLAEHYSVASPEVAKGALAALLLSSEGAAIAAALNAPADRKEEA